ncbi:MAG: protein kinase domain-containing protein, partial [Steroidobacteraceae bacterium]
MNLDAEQALFDACLQADAKRREELIAACGNAALAARVRRLLEIHDRGPSALDARLESLSPLAMPGRIGPYTVIRRLGEGAMGDVYLAEQHEPVRRRVAIKVIKFGLSTREVIARFELERRALAMLAHPNIARILDAGSTEDGRPFFAMEYVDGRPITHHCEERGMGLGERLALFAKVCAGVQHAHLR